MAIIGINCFAVAIHFGRCYIADSFMSAFNYSSASALVVVGGSCVIFIRVYGNYDPIVSSMQNSQWGS